MATDKKSFLLYCDLIHTVKKMRKEDAGELFLHILEYVNDEAPKTDNMYVDLTFEPIKQQLKRDLEKYEVKRTGQSDAGKVGNLKRWHPDLHKQFMEGTITINEAIVIANDRKESPPDDTQSPPIAEIAVSDTVTVSVIDINKVDSTTAKAIDYDKLLKYINETFGREFRVFNQSVKDKYKARVKEGYLSEDIKNAIDTCKNEEYHIETNFKYCTLEFFSRSTTLDKYSTTKKVHTKRPHIDKALAHQALNLPERMEYLNSKGWTKAEIQKVFDGDLQGNEN